MGQTRTSPKWWGIPQRSNHGEPLVQTRHRVWPSRSMILQLTTKILTLLRRYLVVCWVLHRSVDPRIIKSIVCNNSLSAYSGLLTGLQDYAERNNQSPIWSCEAPFSSKGRQGTQNCSNIMPLKLIASYKDFISSFCKDLDLVTKGDTVEFRTYLLEPGPLSEQLFQSFPGRLMKERAFTLK